MDEEATKKKKKKKQQQQHTLRTISPIEKKENNERLECT